MKKIKDLFKKINISNNAKIAWLLFGLNLFFVFNKLLPSLRDLNLWDESVYIYSGKQLVEGILPSFSRNPLVAILYALTYLPFFHSPYWLIQSAGLGRIILFSLMWLSSYLIARQFNKQVPHLILVALVVIFYVLTDILGNPSDSLFAAMSGFSFWQVLSFYNTKENNHLRYASIFMALAAFSRNDGLIGFILLIIIAFFLSGKSERNWNWISNLVFPFAGILIGYFLIYGLITGDFNLYTKERSYTAFLQGQSIDYKRDVSCELKYLKCAVNQAEQAYGTGKDNNYSVLRAIAHNPQAFASRFKKQLGLFPDLIQKSYGKRTAFLVLLLALAGLFELIKKKQFALLAAMLLWMSSLGIYFLTFFRKGYLQLPYFIIYMFAGIGLYSLAVYVQTQNKKQLRIITLILAGLTIAGVVVDLQSLYFTTIVLLAAIWIGYLFDTFSATANRFGPALALILACVIINGNFDPPIKYTLGEIPEEHAVALMQEKLPLGSLVGAGAPGAVWAARMTQVDLGDAQYLTNSPQELHELLVSKGVKAIYVDPYLSNANEAIWVLIEPEIKTGYETLYSSSDGSIRVLLVKP